MSLTAAHQAELLASTIDPAIATERGYLSLTVESRDHVLAARFPTWAAGPDESYPLLFVPMHGPGGDVTGAQIKPALAPIGPGGKAMKYASRRNAANVLDVHPRNATRIRDPAQQLWITEGIKKGDALTSRGLCVVTLTGVFNWRSKLGTIGDWEDVPLKGRSVVVCFDSDARSNDQVLAAMRRLGNWIVGKGAAEVTYVIVPAAVGDIAVKGVDDYFAAGGDLDGLSAVASRAVPSNSTVADPAFTDAYLAGSVADDQLEGRYLYSPGLGGWQLWDGKRWVRCGTESVIEEIRRYAIDQHGKALEAYAADTGSGKAKRLLDGWRSVLARNKLSSVEALARGILITDAQGFDMQPELLNVANGVVDLTTGTLLPHDPDLRLTKLSPTAYVAGAEHPDWKQALGALPEDVHDWYQRRMGQSATGSSPADDYLIVQVGTGSNGKSTVMDSIGRTLGDYYSQLSHRALLASSDAHPTEMMDLKGARLAVIEETPEERRLNVTRLKQAVGTARIKARYMRADSATFDATHTLFLNTNFPPSVEETDWGTWRRLAMVRFPFRWLMPGKTLEGPQDRHGDPDLRRRLKESPNGQHEAILAWLVAGAVAVHRDGFPLLPPRVETDTRTWRGESDQLTAYVTERVVQDWGSWVTCRDLLEDFNRWLRDHNHREWSDRLLSSRMQGMDTLRMEKKAISTVTPGRSTPAMGGWQVSGEKVKAWVGIRLTGG